MQTFFSSSSLFWLFGFLFFSISHSQNPAAQEAYSSFDKVIGLENTNIFNGKEYLEQHIIRNQMHKFFQWPEFRKGTVVYDGLPYYNIPMKFNVYDDLLLVKIGFSEGERTFQLHKELVQEFYLEDHRFVNLQPKRDEGGEVNGFHEVIMENETFRLFKKHFKKRRKYLDADFTYFEFERDDSNYIWEYNNEHQVLDSRRHLMQEFPSHRREIRQYYRRNKSLEENNPDMFYVGLFEKLADLLSTTYTIEE